MPPRSFSLRSPYTQEEGGKIITACPLAGFSRLMIFACVQYSNYPNPAFFFDYVNSTSSLHTWPRNLKSERFLAVPVSVDSEIEETGLWETHAAAARTGHRGILNRGHQPQTAVALKPATKEVDIMTQVRSDFLSSLSSEFWRLYSFDGTFT